MLKGIKELVDLILLWGFWYVGSFMIMVVAIFYTVKTNPTPHTLIIHQHYSTVKVVQPPKRVLIEKEICTRLDGCPIVNNVCVDCLTVKN